MFTIATVMSLSARKNIAVESGLEEREDTGTSLPPNLGILLGHRRNGRKIQGPHLMDVFTTDTVI